MLKIGIHAFGTRGDISPFLALACEASKAGHQVTLVATTLHHSDYSGYEEKYGIRLIHAVDREWFANNDIHALSSEEFTAHVVHHLNNYVNPYVEKICMENDVVIGLEGSYQLHTFAEIHKIPFVTVSYQHSLTPTIYKPYLFHLTEQQKSPEEIRSSWDAVEKYINQKFTDDIDEFRKAQGLGPIKNLFRQITHSDTLQLLAVSKAFCKQYDDWSDHRYVCGFFYLPNLMDAEPLPQDLESFISSGDAPIFFTLGSSNFEEELKIDHVLTVINSARAVSRKVIIQTKVSKAELEKIDIRDDVYFVTGIIDYLSLFPKCSVVVHHGGAGTTHLTLLCGCPSVILESGADTPVWALELLIAGIAPENIPLAKLNSVDLTDRLKIVLSGPDMKERAMKISEIMQSETGAKKAVEVLTNKFSPVIL